MALAALKKCANATCYELVRGRPYCAKHKPKPKPIRKASAAYHHLYNGTWKRKALKYRQAHPVCVACEAVGRVEAAYCVDHIVPHSGNHKMFWDKTNWQSMCRSCHNQKTRREQTG